METSGVRQNMTHDDPVWYFLAEYSLSDFILDDDSGDKLSTELLFQTIRNLGIPAECLKNIENTLKGFANEAMMHSKQGKLEPPIYFRLFCQKKALEDGISVKSLSDCKTEPSIVTSQMIHPSDPRGNGGWGYFLIERGQDSLAESSASSHHLVDLYLYKEGA